MDDKLRALTKPTLKRTKSESNITKIFTNQKSNRTKKLYKRISLKSLKPRLKISHCKKLDKPLVDLEWPNMN